MPPDHRLMYDGMVVRIGMANSKLHRTIGHGPIATLFGASLSLAILLGLGYFAAGHLKYALVGALAILGLSILVNDMRFFPVVAVIGTLVVQRVGGASSALSVSDLVLFLGTISAVPLVRLREAPELRRLLLLSFTYEALVLVSVVYNPYRADFIEWVHEAMLVAGSLIVGWVVGYGGKAKVALSGFLIGASAMAIWACFYCVTHNFLAANLPYGMQKNYVGDMLSFAVVLAYARPSWIGWKTRWTKYVIAITLLGILASQSKQAMISCGCGVAIIAFRAHSDELSRRSRLILLAIVPILIFAYVVAKQEVVSSNRFNSVHQRFSYYYASLAIWHTSPILGVGLRWWYTTRFADPFQPPNAELEMLTSAGVLGVLAFLILMIGALVVLWKLPAEFGTLAFALLLMRLVQGQLDIFWVTAQGSFPWIFAGLALGVMAASKARSSNGVVAQL
jgi:polysaccharide biosynthesis protein PslJ